MTLLTRRNLFALAPALAAALSSATATGCRAAGEEPAAPTPTPTAAERQAPKKAMNELTFYVGTYAKAEEPGIYQFRLNTETGALTKGASVSGVANPSFLAVDPAGRHLYAVSEVGKGMVYAFAIAPDGGALSPLGTAQSSEGDGPCHISVDPSGKVALVANYGGGSIAALPIAADGSLGAATAAIKHSGSSVNPKRQDKPYAHSLNAHPSGRYAVAADLGADKLFVYKLDAAKGTLTPATPPATAAKPGAGPRHFAFRKDGKFAYAINELTSTVSAYTWDAGKGTLTEVQTLSSLPEGFSGSNSPSEVQVHPSGKFLYGANRGHNSIAVFAIDAKSGKLKPVQHQETGGKNPRNFGIDPSGRFLIAANQDTNSLVVYRIDANTGKLTPAGHTAELTKPVCIRFLPAGK